MTAAPLPPMKLALVVERFDPSGGGAERSTLELVASLHRRGHQVTLFAGRCPREPDPLPGGTLVGLSPRALSGGWSVLGFSRWARGHLTRGDFDASLSFATSVPATLVEPWGGTVRETLDRNIAMREHAVGRAWKRLRLAVIFKQQMFLRLERATLRSPQVKQIVALSPYVAEQLARHYQIAPDRIAIVPNAVSVPTL